MLRFYESTLPLTQKPWPLFHVTISLLADLSRRRHFTHLATADFCWQIVLEKRRSSFALDPIPRSWLRLGRVAASASERREDHSLALAATREKKRAEGNWHRSGLIKCPGACLGDFYFVSARPGSGRPINRFLAPVD